MGRDKRNEKLASFVPVLFRTLDSPAWLALSVHAKALYPALKRRAGAYGVKNGHFSMSVREAAEYLGTGKNKAQETFHELQAKGFLVPQAIGALGAQGEGRATVWRLTEIGTPENRTATAEFMQWHPGQDFPIRKGPKPGPRVIDSRVKKQKPVPPTGTPCPSERDV